jgi:thioesterase domain-containing protein
LIKVENPLLHSDVHRGWEQVFKGSYETHTVGGEHLNMLEEPYAADVARLLVRHLQKKS